MASLNLRIADDFADEAEVTAVRDNRGAKLALHERRKSPFKINARQALHSDR